MRIGTSLCHATRACTPARLDIEPCWRGLLLLWETKRLAPAGGWIPEGVRVVAVRWGARCLLAGGREEEQRRELSWLCSEEEEPGLA